MKLIEQFLIAWRKHRVSRRPPLCSFCKTPARLLEADYRGSRDTHFWECPRCPGEVRWWQSHHPGSKPVAYAHRNKADVAAREVAQKTFHQILRRRVNPK